MFHDAIHFFQFLPFIMDNSPYWDMAFNVFSFTLITHPSSCSPHLMHHQKVLCVFNFVNKCFCSVLVLFYCLFLVSAQQSTANRVIYLQCFCQQLFLADFHSQIRGPWTLFLVISVSGVQGVLVIFSILGGLILWGVLRACGVLRILFCLLLL